MRCSLPCAATSAIPPEVLQLHRLFVKAVLEGELTHATIYKIATRSQWDGAQREGRFIGAPVDLADGFIHFSTAAQMRETAAKHFAGQTDLLLLAVDAAPLGPDLRYEPSRGGDLFPHLYAPLPLQAVTAIFELPLGPDGHHVFPQAVLDSADP